MRDVIASLYSPDLAERFPLLRQPAKIKRAAVIVLTANRGLAGAFNANLIKEARATIARLEGEGVTVDIHAVGKKGAGYFRYVGRKIASSRIDIGDRPTAENAAELVNDLTAAFARGEIDAVYVVYPNVKSALSAPPTTLQVLPVQPPEGQDEAARLHPLAGRADDPRRAAAAVRPQRRLSRAGRDDRGVLRGAAHGNEERDRQRERHAQGSCPDVQSCTSGHHHAGDRRDRRRRCGTSRVS